MDEQTPEVEQPKDEAPATKRRFPVKALLFASIIVLIGLSSLFAWQDMQSQKKALTIQNDILAADVEAANTQMALLRQQVKRELAHQKTTLLQMTQTLQKANQARGDKSQDFLMSEAHYFMRLANYVLQFERNVPMGMQLMQMADDNLKEAGTPEALALRQTISDNIATLNTVPQVNIEDLYLRINTLSKQIDTLSVRTPEARKKLNTQKPEGWVNNLKASFHSLKGLVVIRRHDDFSKSRLTPQAIDQLLQNMHLHMGTAQFALLQKQNAIYHASLKQIISWANEYLDPQDPKTADFIASCQQLNSINLNPRIPTILIPSNTLALPNAPAEIPFTEKPSPASPAVAL